MKLYGKILDLSQEGHRLYEAFEAYLIRTGLDEVIDIFICGSEDIRMAGELNSDQVKIFDEDIFQFDGELVILGYSMNKADGGRIILQSFL